MKFTSIIAMTAAVAAVLVPSLTSAQSNNATLSILSNNVYFLSHNLYPNWGQVTRAGLISKSDYIKNHDVVVLQECFEVEACDAIRAGLASQYPYQTPTVGQSKSGWDSTSGSYSSTSIEDGGVTILSKWPIKQKHQFVYKNACGADWFSNKGFAYVILDYKGTNIHVFGTHMQSDDSMCTSGQAAKHRGLSLDQWRQYIDSRNIPANELVIMAGDFNILKDSSEFSGLLSRLGAVQPQKYQGWPWTWDTADNSIAKYNYPNMPSEYIDFVFTDAKHSAGVRSVVQTSLRVKSSPYVLKGATYDDYSDHYPIATEIQVDL
ncbi:MAG: sphingomyelin phosphodiesterase [Linnemannia gamsii]|nr:MAG: sphingomyelin phosphodiesterase [Linnemannia gamsii]